MALIAAFVLVPLRTSGQEVPLDLRAALATAQSSNLELRAARQQRAIAVAGITTAGLLPNPTFSFVAAKDTPHEGITVDIPLELGGKRGKRLAVAREEQKSIEVDVSVLERQIRRRTRQAFYEAVAAQAETTQSKFALDLSTHTRDMVQARYEAGDVAQLDVIQAEVEVAKATSDYETATQAQRSAEVLLAGLLSRPITAPVSISGKLDELPPSPTLDAATAQAMVGLVVKNGIILFEYYERLHGTMSVTDALVQAGRIRLRPILMTTLCTLFGLLPLALGIGSGAELQRPLAIAVIGGLTISMFVTLVVIPVAYATVRGLTSSEIEPASEQQ